MKTELKIGQKVKFLNEKQRFTVKAVSDRFVILTKPFNLQNTVIYAIIDWERNVRGPNDMLFNPYDYEDQEGIEECLRDLESGQTKVSFRYELELDIERVDEK